MRILITGGTGLLGKALMETKVLCDNVWAIYYGNYEVKDSKEVSYLNANICDKASMEKIFLSADPEVVIHTAGIASVDYCEKYLDEARQSNVTGTSIITDLCRKTGSKIVFISTNAVFDGKNAPYSEKSVPSPINSYGKIKLEAEAVVRESGLRHLIVRPLLMYGWNDCHERSNPATWLIEKLKKKERVNIVNDIYENPLFNISCAEIIWTLVSTGKEGLYHVAGRDVVNRYELARAIADVFGLDSGLLNEVSSEFFPGLAPRPRNTSYDTSKIEKELGVKTLGLKEGLGLMKKMKEGRNAKG